jgi:hypothetical protein
MKTKSSLAVEGRIVCLSFTVAAPLDMWRIVRGYPESANMLS